MTVFLAIFTKILRTAQILAETIEDLVDGAPGSLAFDGSLLLGAKDTTLYVLDAKSGRLIEEVAAVGGRLLQVAAILGEQGLESCLRWSLIHQSLLAS